MAYRLYMFILAAGLALGLVSADWLIEMRPFSSASQGVWRVVPTLGDLEASPYVRAYRVKHALIASSGRDTLVFTASRDAEGRPLEGGCTYEIAGRISNTGWWSLRSETTGQPARQSRPVGWLNNLISLHAASGEVVIRTGPRPRPGNWLATPQGPMRLVLTLYDAPFASDNLGNDLRLPQIRRRAC